MRVPEDDVAPLKAMLPVAEPVVPRVKALAPWIVSVPVKLAALLIVCEFIVLLVAIVVIPLRAPALLTSNPVESITSNDEPPPIVVVPVLEPVLILVAKLELLLIEAVAPETVTPPVP